tara:strand:+ start:491 stop:1621 length:1131 start_codon:yes stop_codon:yes gene_type:complete
MKKILIVFGTRPEAIKMAPLIKNLKASNVFNLKICSTGQHKEMLDQVLSIFKIEPDFNINIMRSNQTLNNITSNILNEFEKVLDEFNPDLVMVHGDTSTTFAAALSSFHKNIDVAHVEAGLRSFNIKLPFPEEANRKLTSQISKYHFAPTKKNKKNLLKEGIAENQIVVTGNTVIDALHSILNVLKNDKVGEKIRQNLTDIGINFQNKIILVTGHRRESFDGGLKQVCIALKELAQKYPSIDIIYPVHLNPNVQDLVLNELSNFKNVKLIDPLDYKSFIYLMNECFFVITDSGGIQEEAPSIGKPVLVTRVSSERPEAIEEGVVELVGYDKDKIVRYSSKLIEDNKFYNKMSSNTKVYGDGTASKTILEFCLKKIV